MKGAADFKQMALDALRGRWLLAVGTGFVASLLGAGVATGGSSNSGTFVYDGTDMTLTGSSTAVIRMPKGGEQISASGLDKLGGHDGVQAQTLYKVYATDSATLCNIAAIIFGG